MRVEMLQCEQGYYHLVVDDQLLLRTKCKRSVEYYYREAQAHTSSNKYRISVAEPYNHTSSN